MSENTHGAALYSCAAETKSGLRRLYLLRRHNLSEAVRREQDSVLCRVIALSDAFRNAETVLMYCPFGDEVDIMPLFTLARKTGKRVAFPRCDRSAHTIAFYYADSADSLIPGAFGIREPCKNEKYADGDSVCIVPSLVCDRYGFRIGYGGGYYDRFLAGYTNTTVLAVRDGFLSEEPLPRDEYDTGCNLIALTGGVICAETQ